MTRTTRILIAPATAVMAALLLGGCQASNNSSEGDLPASSESSPAATASSGSGSASAKPSPKPTGAQVVQIGGPDSKDTKETARKEAFEAVRQYNRLVNAWGSSNAEMDNYSDDELKKFLEGDALKQTQDVHTKMLESRDKGFQPDRGQIEVRLLDMDNAGLVDFGNGKTWEHGSVQLRVCEDWSSIKNSDGSASIPDDKKKRVIRASVVRGEDGYYYLNSYRVDHYGCD